MLLYNHRAKYRPPLCKIETSKYRNYVDELIEKRVTYEEISRILNNKGENISKSAVGRYAKKYYEQIKKSQ